MNVLEIIEKKKRGLPLSREELSFVVNGYVDGTVPDYQVSAWLMAVNLIGMSERETFDLTDVMLKSGEVNDFDGRGYLDKHSTGGVGDSTTLIVLPVLASMGYKFWKMSGAGLGHTGGTLDKLNSVGAETSLTAEQAEEIVNTHGFAVVGQTKNLCPADKKLYALRDVTATVDSVPLIASSIMSKKLAGGADGIVLDVKCGSGAFMKRLSEAESLAHAMVKIGENAGKNVVAVITDMNEPLSDYVGNRMEIYGVFEVLDGKKNKLYEVSRALAVALLAATGLDEATAYIRFDEEISTGRAKQKLIDVLKAQGATDESLSDLLRCNHTAEVRACASGFVGAVDTEAVGRCAMLLGAGRAKLGEAIDYEAGLVYKVRIGDYVSEGDVLFTAHFNDKSKVGALVALPNAIKLTDRPVDRAQAVLKIAR